MPRKLPSVKKYPARPRGPAWAKLNKDPERLDNIFMNPPIQFDTPHTSNTEWWLYCAMALVTGSPRPFHKPPFNGGLDWQYQSDVQGGRTMRMGQVADVIYQDRIMIRLQTGYWHLEQGAETYHRDLFLRTHSPDHLEVIDIFDVHFLHDPSGRAICAITKLALAGVQLPDPWVTGNYAPVYPGVL